MLKISHNKGFTLLEVMIAVAILAVAGNIAVGWSWFGVNELGVGLHSYGFTEGVLRSLGMFIISQLAIIGLGLLPEHLWWSNRGKHRRCNEWLLRGNRRRY